MGRETKTEFDGAGRPVKVTAPFVDDGSGAHTVSPVTQSVYDGVGNVVAVIDPLGRQTDFQYDPRNRKLRAISPSVLDETTSSWRRSITSSTYDGIGNVITVTDPNASITTSKYDAANRLEELRQPSVAGGTPVTKSTYDKNGNVLTVTDARSKTVTNTYDALNRLKTTTDAANIQVNYAYDAVATQFKGRLTRPRILLKTITCANAET